MRLYDGNSSVEWYYVGTMTREQMEASSYYAKVVNEPCVLFDDADGKVVTFKPLSELAVELAVPTCYPPEQVFDEVKAKLEGTYKAPGVAEAQATADEAKTTADTAAASMNEYLDALLGLDATDETEATDAE